MPSNFNKLAVKFVYIRKYKLYLKCVLCIYIYRMSFFNVFTAKFKNVSYGVGLLRKIYAQRHYSYAEGKLAGNLNNYILLPYYLQVNFHNIELYLLPWSGWIRIRHFQPWMS